MEAKTNPIQTPLNWFEIWRTAFFRPTLETFSQIINDPKASIKWGIIWMAIITLIIWVAGPQRDLWWGIVVNNFGFQAGSYFVVFGAIIAPALGVSALLINAAIAHGLANLFKGEGTFHQLVYCWGVMPLPFVVISMLAYHILPFIIFSFHLIPDLTKSTLGIISLASLVIAAALLIYLLYAEIVAFGAVERFSFGKSFGILILVAMIISIANIFISSGVQAAVMKSLRY